MVKSNLKLDGRLEAITSFNINKNNASIYLIQVFLGMVNFFQKYIKNYTNIIAPILVYLKTGIPYPEMAKKSKLLIKDFSPEAEVAIETLKKALIEPPIFLWLPNPDIAYVLTCDASNVAIGSYLSQTINGNIQVIGYFNKKLNSAEMNYSTTDRECMAVRKSMEHFHHLTHSHKPITIITDHDALRYLLTAKNLTGRLLRWSLYLQQWRIIIMYRPGKENVVADALSRAYVQPEKPATTPQIQTLSQLTDSNKEENSIPNSLPDTISDNISNPIPTTFILEDLSVNIETIKLNQKKDNYCQSVILDLNSNNPTLQDKFRFNEHGLLVKTDRDPKIIYKELIVIPKVLIKRILVTLHENNAHVGRVALYQLVGSRFYWPNFTKDIEAHVASCEICAQVKSVPHLHLPNYVKRPVLPIPTRPGEILHTDYVGKLTPCANGDKFILTFIDAFDMKFYAFSSPKADNATFIKYLLMICSTNPIPKVIISDRGGAFIHGNTPELSKWLGFTMSPTTAYRPNANGLVERYHRELKEFLITLCHATPKKWNEYLPFAVMAHNNKVSRVLGYSPIEISTGYTSTLPIDNALDINSNPIALSSTPSLVNIYKQNLNNIHDIVRKKLQDRVENLEKILEEVKAQNPCAVGQLYMRIIPLGKKMIAGQAHHHKLKVNYDGPWVVEKILSLSTVEIKLVGASHKKPLIVNIDKLKPFNSSKPVKEQSTEEVDFNVKYLDDTLTQAVQETTKESTEDLSKQITDDSNIPIISIPSTQTFIVDLNVALSEDGTILDRESIVKNLRLTLTKSDVSSQLQQFNPNIELLLTRVDAPISVIQKYAQKTTYQITSKWVYLMLAEAIRMLIDMESIKHKPQK